MRRLTPNHPVFLALSAGAAVVAIVTGVYSLGWSQDLKRERGFETQFIQPVNGAAVGPFADVEYALIGSRPKGTATILLVRDSYGHYWSHGPVQARTRRRVQIGVLEDAGREFEILLLVTGQPPPVGVPMMQQPVGIAYTSIRVTRQ